MTKTAAKETQGRGAKDIYVRERLGTPTDLKPEATRDISAALAGLLADVFALYMKTKNFHWHMSGAHFRDYHLLLDEHGRADFRHDRPDRRAGAQDRRRRLSARSATSRDASAFSTTTPTMSIRRTCWRNCATTTRA